MSVLQTASSVWVQQCLSSGTLSWVFQHFCSHLQVFTAFQVAVLQLLSFLFNNNKKLDLSFIANTCFSHKPIPTSIIAEEPGVHHREDEHRIWNPDVFCSLDQYWNHSRYSCQGFAFKMPFREGISALFHFCFFFPPSVNFAFGFLVGTFCFVCSKSPDVSPDIGDQLCHGAGLWICRKLGAACILSLFNSGAVVKLEIFIDQKLTLDKSRQKVADARDCRREKAFSSSRLRTHNEKEENFLIFLQIYEGIPILSCWGSLPLGGKAIHK